MILICSAGGRKFRTVVTSLGVVVVLVSIFAAPACGQRVFGIDTSSVANGSNIPTQTQWNNAYNDPDHGGAGYKFAIVRSSRGGTSDATRFDDPHFYDNITRSKAAGMLSGSYHFARPDAFATHTAIDDANHYLEMAGSYMKPGFLLPVFDLEDGNTEHSQASLTTWSIDFINTILNATGVAPIVYTSSSYNTDEVTPEVAWYNVDANPATPHSNPRTYQWIARPGGNIETGHPVAASGYPDPYGGWDPDFTTKSASTDPAIKPWVFWQQQFTTTDPHFGFTVDYNAANGNIEFVRDFLVPALWTNAGSGDWGTVANWNSNNAAYNGTIQSGPAPRLPGYDASNPTFANRKFDWVKLQNPGDGTVTISSGAQAVRKFYTQQPLNITGGSLTVHYIPGAGGKWDLPSEFNDAVTLSSGAAYTAHTTQVDGGGGLFNVNGGTVSFRSMDLASHASTPGKIVMGGNATFADFDGTGTAVIRSTGSLAQAGTLDLGAATRTLTVNNGSAAVDVSIQTAVTGTGGLAKSGAGTLQLTGTNTYSGGTTVNSGILRITRDANLGAAPAGTQANNIVLNGGTLQTGAEIAGLTLDNAGSGYTSVPTASFGGAGPDAVAPTASVLARISSVQVTSGGSGYTGTAKVVLVGGGGTGATATAVMSGGAVSAINITNQGNGYTSLPTVYITDGSGQGVAGDGAAAVVNGITLTSLSPTGAGFDYASPTVTLIGGGGTGAAASATASTNLALNSNRGIELTASGGTLYQTASTTFTVSGPISSTGNGTLTKSGPGTLVLNGDNTYSGATAITGGVLQTGANEHLPDTTRVTVTSPGTFDVNGLTETIGSLEGNGSVTNFGLLIAGGDNTSTSFSGTLSGASLRKTGAGTMTLSGSNSYSGGTNIVEGTLSGNSIAHQGTNSAFGTSNFSIANGATLEYTGFTAITNRTISLDSGGGTVSVSDTGSLRVNGIISGSSLTKAGAGTFVLGGVNTYAGATTINSGVLQLGNTERIPNTSRVTVNGPGTFDANTRSETIGSLEGDGSVTNIDLLTTGGDNSSTTFSGTIDGGTLIKTGTGTMTLSGVSSYSGGTEISGGTFSGNSIADQGIDSAFGTADFTIANGATLEYTGPDAATNRSIFLDTGGGIVSVPSGASQLTFNGIIAGSSLVKAGAGSLILSGANSHTGGTIVNAGLFALTGAAATLGSGNVTVLDAGVGAGAGLLIQSSVINAIDDAATLSLFGGGTPDVADAGFAFLETGIVELVGSLMLNGVPQLNGTYGATGSGAANILDEYFGGSGILQVGDAPPIFPGDYNDDGVIDAADHVVWKKNVGQPAGTLPNDNTGLPIGGDQYNLWTTNFGSMETGSSGSGTIPEPSSITVLMLAFVLLAGYRRRG